MIAMDKFRNKYRIQTARLQNWNYRWNGAYFVTVCTLNRQCYLGEIVDSYFISTDFKTCLLTCISLTDLHSIFS